MNTSITFNNDRIQFFKKNIVLFLNIVLILSILIFYAFPVGPFTVKQYTSVFIFTFVIVNKKKFSFQVDKVFRLYIFLMCYHLILTFFNGDLDFFPTYELFLGKYFIIIITYLFLNNLYDVPENIIITIKFLLLIGFINTIFSILQFLQIPQIWTITSLIFKNINYLGNGLVEIGFEQELNGSIFGITGNVVLNGYIISAIFPLTILIIKGRRFYFSMLWKTIALVTAIMSVISTIVIQQRTALIIMLISIGFIFIKKISPKAILILLFIGSTFYIFSDELLNFTKEIIGIKFLRIEILADESRSMVYKTFLEYFNNNMFWGGVNNYLKFNNHLDIIAHNMFLNSVIYFGLFGALVYVFISFSFAKEIYKNMLADNPITFYLSLAFINYFALGLTHNLSVVTGDIFIWVLWLLTLKSKCLITNGE